VLAVCKGLLLAGGLLAGWAIVQFLFIPGDFGRRAQGPFADPNALAALLSLGLLPVLGLYFGDTGRARGWLWPLALLLFAAIFATESRAAIACTAIAYLLLSLWMKPKARSHARILIPAALLFAACNMIDHMRFGDRLAKLAAPLQDGNVQSRLALWKSAWHMARDHMLAGRGYGTFYVYYPSYRLPGLDNSPGFWAHMDPLQLWGEVGIAGPVLFYAIAAAVFARTLHALRQEGVTSRERGLIAGLGAGMAALFLQAHLSFPLYQMPILIALGSALALWHMLTAAPVKTVALAGAQKAVIAGVALCIAGFIALMAASSAAATHYFLAAQDKIRDNDAQGFLTAIEKAQHIAPVSYIEPQVQLAGLYIDMLTAPDQFFPLANRVEMYKQALLLLDNAQSFNPGWAEIDYKRGLLYASGGGRGQPADEEKAKQAWETALRKDPMHYKARERLVAYYMKRGDVERAAALIDAGLAYPQPPQVMQGLRDAKKRLDNFVAIKSGYESRKGGAQEKKGQSE
jgi:hypothetical protein